MPLPDHPNELPAWAAAAQDGIAWDNTAELGSLDGPELEAELDRLAGLLTGLEATVETLVTATNPDERQRLAGQLASGSAALIGPIDGLIYLAYIEIAVDATRSAAHVLAGHAEGLRSRLREVMLAVDAWRGTATDPHQLDVDDPHGFVTASLRWRPVPADFETETAIERLSTSGPLAWERLYKQIVGGFEIHLPGEAKPVGLAALRRRLQGPDRPARRVAWEAKCHGRPSTRSAMRRSEPVRSSTAGSHWRHAPCGSSTWRRGT